MKLIIQIPCYNEEETLHIALNELPKKIEGIDEIEYLINSKKSARLASQIGKENIPKDEAGLQISALVDEAF